MGGPTPEELAKPGTEISHQTAVFAWAALHAYRWPELDLLFAVPNGGGRNKIEAGFLKGSGVRSGVPDVCLPVARWGLHGLWIELKIGKNTLSENQLAWIKRLNVGGYAALVAYSWNEAIDYITVYLEEKNEKFQCSSAYRSFMPIAEEIRAYYTRLRT